MNAAQSRLRPELPPIPVNTRWKNPTEHYFKVIALTESNRRVLLDFPPHSEREYPSQFDRAIHQIDPTDETKKKILGGGCPLLIKLDEPDRILSPGLDPVQAARKEAMERAQATLAERAAIDAALKLAGAEVLEAERQLEAATAPQKPAAAQHAQPKR